MGQAVSQAEHTGVSSGALAPMMICGFPVEGVVFERRTDDGELCAAVDQYAGHQVGFSAIVQSCVLACEHVNAILLACVDLCEAICWPASWLES